MKTRAGWRLLCVLLMACAATSARGQSKSLDSCMEDAKRGDAYAQNEVGIIYAEGIGVVQNNREGVKWFRLSAEQGNVYGACNLGLHYGRGTGVNKNLTQAMKWSFIAHSLDGLKCHPGDFIEFFRLNRATIEKAWDLAVTWLRTHPELKNNFGDAPWLESDGEWPITLREHGPQVKLPIKRKRRRN